MDYVGENGTSVKIDSLNLEFDGMWASSLTDSTSKGKPDIEAVDTSSRLSTLNEVMEVTTKPIIYDGDTGGKPEHFTYTVQNLERLGVSAVVIEDKKGLKKNSLFPKGAFGSSFSSHYICFAFWDLPSPISWAFSFRYAPSNDGLHRRVVVEPGLALAVGVPGTLI